VPSCASFGRSDVFVSAIDPVARLEDTGGTVDSTHERRTSDARIGVSGRPQSQRLTTPKLTSPRRGDFSNGRGRPVECTRGGPCSTYLCTMYPSDEVVVGEQYI